MMSREPIYFAAKPGSNFGWGICNTYLYRELSQLTKTILVEPETPYWSMQDLPGSVFTALQNFEFDPYAPTRGIRNYGYTFFENELSARSYENAQRFDLILGGCSWCCEIMQAAGISHCAPLVQGIDTAIFKSTSEPLKDEAFYVFSGGKLELRKGQDLVLRAIQILQQKYPDIVLVNAWYNMWPQSIQTMALSRHIDFQMGEGTWQEKITYLCARNGLKPDRLRTLPLMPHEKMARIYQQTHLGVFPNRCEGGTNLVMMEYMACGKPVVATNATGHRDIVTGRNAFLLNQLNHFHLHGDDGKIVAKWYEASLDELVGQIEYAYLHREVMAEKGAQAAIDLQRFTWKTMAQNLLQLMGL